MDIIASNNIFIVEYNQSLLCDTSKPDSMLNNKSNSIAYPFMIEGLSMDEWRAVYVNTSYNQYGMLTKPLKSDENKKIKARMIMYNLYPKKVEG